MKSPIECVSPETSVREAARKLRDHNIGFLPVCDEAMRPVGTLTDRDSIAIRAVAEEMPLASPVEACMTWDVVSCNASDDIQEARDLMESYQVSRIICTGRQGRVVGVISLSDIVDVDEDSGAQTLRRVSQREVRGDGRYVGPGL
jgi:CBS domain-containing protein